MLKHERVLWITRTAVLIAATVALQAVTMQFANQFITGSIVNLMLILSVMVCGLATGLTVSVVTPILPTLLGFGFGPFWQIIPFIAAGNMALVFLWHIIGNREIGIKYVPFVLALIAGATAKFLVLYFGVVQIALPYILGMPGHPLLSVMFSYPQLITAATGGACATFLLPTLRKAVKSDKT